MSSEPTPKTKSSWASKEAKEIIYRPLANSLSPSWWTETQSLIEAALLQAEARGAAEENESCAKVAEQATDGSGCRVSPGTIAKAIRQRTGRKGI